MKYNVHISNGTVVQMDLPTSMGQITLVNRTWLTALDGTIVRLAEVVAMVPVAEPTPTPAEEPEPRDGVAEFWDKDGDKWRRASNGLYSEDVAVAPGDWSFEQVRRTWGPLSLTAPAKPDSEAVAEEDRGKLPNYLRAPRYVPLPAPEPAEEPEPRDGVAEFWDEHGDRWMRTRDRLYSLYGRDRGDGSSFDHVRQAWGPLSLTAPAEESEPEDGAAEFWDKDGDRWRRTEDGLYICDDSGCSSGYRAFEQIRRLWGPLSLTAPE